MRDEIASYLRSVGNLYPGGIPRSMIGARSAPQKTSGAPLLNSPRKVAFYWLDSGFQDGLDSLSGAEGELLRAAIDKGLKLSSGEVRVVRSADAAALTAAFAASEAAFAVILGEETARILGQAATMPGVFAAGASNAQIMKTLDLPSVLSDQLRKKVFWSHLQEILKRL